jgi:hypothetical protein
VVIENLYEFEGAPPVRGPKQLCGLLLRQHELVPRAMRCRAALAGRVDLMPFAHPEPELTPHGSSIAAAKGPLYCAGAVRS